jgi:hypothetical protein
MKSQEQVIELVSALLNDSYHLAGLIAPSDCSRDALTVTKRLRCEGLSFISKTLPRLGKAFDKALTGNKFDAVGFLTKTTSKLPIFMGKLFKLVFDDMGVILPEPDSRAIQCIRQVLYSFYKYETPYTQEQAQKVIKDFQACEAIMDFDPSRVDPAIVLSSQSFLRRLFAGFDPRDIKPRHGPGAVAERLQPPDKWQWNEIPERLLDLYGVDYFTSGVNHIVDALHVFIAMPDSDPSARVILVNKDSRGPRLISCEPYCFQYVQQGLMRSLVDLIEHHPLTRQGVHFRDQSLNQNAALMGSISGKLATLDLKEASDRVSLGLVKLLFPDWLMPFLESCRSHATVLPDGSTVVLKKFAPMGSALCFPILALTIYALLRSAGIGSDKLLVYGDDVIVPIEDVSIAIQVLESAGLLVNRDKSCTAGLFRESCGMDAYNGVPCTPIRFRTVWDRHPTASAYVSWISYQNEFFVRKYYQTAQVITEWVRERYRFAPCQEGRRAYPSLMSPGNFDSNGHKPKRRINFALQRVEVKAIVPFNATYKVDDDGWWKVLRYFTETSPTTMVGDRLPLCMSLPLAGNRFDASVYTHRSTTLRGQWCADLVLKS